jgi:hypothetical protein
MSWLFKLLGRKTNHSADRYNYPEVKKEVFIEEPAAENSKAEVEKKAEQDQDNIHLLYAFLLKDYQQQGYNDALLHPDTSYMAERVKEFRGEINIAIRKVKTFYEDAIRELDFLILSRGRSGMVEVVDELKMRKEKATDHHKKTLEIEQEIIREGELHRLVISYNRGFQNGMAAIAIHEAGKRKF